MKQTSSLGSNVKERLSTVKLHSTVVFFSLDGFAGVCLTRMTTEYMRSVDKTVFSRVKNFVEGVVEQPYVCQISSSAEGGAGAWPGEGRGLGS